MLLQKRYHLVKLISQGGSGKTFLAVDEGQSPPSPCVVKQLDVERRFGSLQFQQYLQRLEAVGQHPQVPKLLAHFAEQGNLYFVHEFIDGTNLARVVEEEGTFSEAQIWQLLADLLPVLQFIHARQLVHRDIKPENIIRSPLSHPQMILVDFGSAELVDVRAIDESPQIPGSSIGSPEYIAPEQLRGKAVFASDLYSLGVTCIYLLTNIPPFDLLDLANDCWAWRDCLTKEVSDRLGKILDKLLQNSLNQRFQSADQVMQAINPILGRNAMCNPTDSTPQPSQFWRCHRILSVNYSPMKRVNSVAFSPDHQFLAAGSDDFLIRLWNPDNEQPIRTLSGHSQAVNSVAFSSQGKLLASASNDQTIKLWNYDTGQEILTLASHSHAVKSVAFSPNGQILASGSWDKTLKLWEVNTGKELWTLKGHKLQISAIAFSADGQLLASASFDRTVRLYSLPYLEASQWCPIETVGTTSLQSILTDHCGHVLAVAFSPDGQTIATASDDHTVKLWDLKTGRVMRTLLGHSWSVVALAFTSDGETLLSGSWDKTVKLWKVSTGKEICTLVGHSDSVCSVAISSTNQLIASSSKDQTVRLWHRDESVPHP